MSFQATCSVCSDYTHVSIVEGEAICFACAHPEALETSGHGLVFYGLLSDLAALEDAR